MIEDDRHTTGYWNRRAQAFLGTAQEIHAVCDASLLVGSGGSAPIEERGARLVESHLPPGARTLEVGCGYGRWFDLMGGERRLIGMDFSTMMGRRAAERRRSVPVLLGDVRQIPVAPGRLDAAYTMKVLQFLPDQERSAAVAGIFAAVRTGGVVVLFEKTARPDGSPPGDWIEWSERAGGRLVAWYGNQFTPVDRALAGVARALRPRLGPPPASSPGGGDPGSPLRRRHPGLFRAYSALQRLELRLSLPAEALFERVLPKRWAEHAVFVFEKTTAA